MIDNFVFWACISVILIGFVVIACISWFGFILSRHRIDKRFPDHPFWYEMINQYMNKTSHYDDIPRYAHDTYTEYLQRRNEFWTTYGQVLIAVLIVIVISVLLMTKTISAEAGLPILSGVSGFAIAKGVSSGRNAGIPQDRQRG
ncbi:MAG: hypothetical protein V1897_07800 [Pseudomonadota bacterium]